MAENGELLYIGKSGSNCMKRICQHKTDGRIPFHHYIVAPIGEHSVTVVEAFLIAELRPPMNISGIAATINTPCVSDYFLWLGERRQLTVGRFEYCLSDYDCKLILRHISTITEREIATMDAVVMNSDRKQAYHNKIEYLRSINVATHFMGIDTIKEGWAILEEKIPANEAQKTKEEN